MSSQPKNPITLALRSYGILLLAILVGLLPYAFTDGPEATAKLMQESGAWILGAAALVALVGYLVAGYALIRGLLGLVKQPDGDAFWGTALALLPLIGLPWLLLSTGIVQVIGH